VSRITSILLRTPSFYLYSRSFVSLKVFDVTGREVAAIISGEVSAGNHTQQWSAGDLPTGIYFYRLFVESSARSGQTSGSYETKKMVLLR
jgi:hypothetical protein